MSPTELKTKLIGIPLLGLFIDSVFFGGRCEFLSFTYFIGLGICIFITAVIWIGNSQIFVHFHKQFPSLQDTFQRTLWIALSCLLFSSFGFLIVQYFLGLLFRENTIEGIDWLGLKITILFATLLVIISETTYFFGQWKSALLDAERLKKENNQAQLDSLRNQVNPHFLFNSLNTLISIIPDSPETAIDFTQKLSNVYRYLLSVRDKELVDLKTELDFIHSYVFLLNVRFGDNLRVDIQVPENNLHMMLPPVSLQMLLENAIKHNVVSKEKPLQIQVYVENGYLITKNNLQAKQQKEESTGIGLENIRKRYAILSDKNMEVVHSAANFTVALPLLKM